MVSLDSEQLEQLKAIGTFLGEVREEEGRTLEDISTKTYIPLRLLKAIEAGQEQILPEPVFVQGFIRRYGDALGLDGSELSRRFPVTVAPMTSAFTAYQESKTSLPDPEPSTSYISPTTNLWQPTELPASRPPYLLIGGIALVALAGLVFGVISPRLKSSAPIAKAPASQPQAIESVAPPSVAPVPSSAASASADPITASPEPVAAIASPADANSPVSIDMNVTDRSWVQVVVDGAVKYEGTLEKGAQQSWAGKESIIISSGNAGAVSVAFNKGAAKTMGKLGEVEEKTYTAKGLQ